MEAPDAVDHNGVVVVVMGPDPAQEGKGKDAINPGEAQGLDGHLREGEVGRTGGGSREAICMLSPRAW